METLRIFSYASNKKLGNHQKKKPFMTETINQNI